MNRNELADRAETLLRNNGGPILAEDTVDGLEYVMVRMDDFVALEAALRDVGDGWLTIDSAPKDARSVLLANAGYVTEGYRGVDGQFRCGVIGVPLTPFTHWQPLPPPPKAAPSGECPDCHDCAPDGLVCARCKGTGIYKHPGMATDHRCACGAQEYLDSLKDRK